jgi:hypothetical protein
MAKFNLTALVTVTVQTTVEADTLEEAIKIADGIQDIGHYKDGVTKDFAWVNDGEFDGLPQNIRQDEV